MIPETHWIYRPDTRNCGHGTREAFAVSLMENRAKIEEVTHTLSTPVGHTRFLGFRTDLFVRPHLPKVTPLHTWFFDPGIHRYRLSYTPSEYHPVISYHLSRCPESHTSRAWSEPLVLSLSNDYHLCGGKRMSQIPAMFPKISYTVDYCGFILLPLLEEACEMDCW